MINHGDYAILKAMSDDTKSHGNMKLWKAEMKAIMIRI